MADVVVLKKNIPVSGFWNREKMSCKFCHDPGRPGLPIHVAYRTVRGVAVVGGPVAVVDPYLCSVPKLLGDGQARRLCLPLCFVPSARKGSLVTDSRKVTGFRANYLIFNEDFNNNYLLNLELWIRNDHISFFALDILNPYSETKLVGFSRGSEFVMRPHLYAGFHCKPNTKRHGDALAWRPSRERGARDTATRARIRTAERD